MAIARARTSGTTVVTTALANRARTSGPARRRNEGELIGRAKVRPPTRRDTRPDVTCRPAGGRPPRPALAPARPATARIDPAGANASPSPCPHPPRTHLLQLGCQPGSLESRGDSPRRGDRLSELRRGGN